VGGDPVRHRSPTVGLIRSGPSSAPGPTTVPDDLAGCVAWIIERIAAAGERADDPLAPEEMARLESPLATAPTGRRFTRWVDHRRATLRAAMKDTETTSADWEHAWRIVAEARAGIVLLLLINAA
jgi:hypothetical protein